ncbi:MAG TPA: ABC transporter ATP-binding protein [Acidimicrobiia bacterium]|jgi:ATP-binding cassette subfamily B protein|nr:ABC transporter ATP-binding protein [Acidimicrobiia bacterium]
MVETTAPPLTRLWRYAARYHRRVVKASVYSILNKAFDIAPPFLIGLAVDVVVNRETSFLGGLGVEDPRNQLVVLAGLTFVVWLLESLFEYLLGVEWRNLAQTVQHELRVDAYTHIQRLEIAYHEDQSTGELMAILNDDVNQLERFLDRGADELLRTATAVVLIGITFFLLTPSVAWLAFLPIPAIVWGSLRFQRRMEPRYATVRNQAGAVNSQLANNLAGIMTIKAFTAEDRETARIAAASDGYRTANRRAISLSAAFSPLIRIAILVGFTATLLWGGFQALDGSLEVGSYSVMVFLTQRLLWPLTSLGETLDLYQRAMASTNRILNVLDTEPQMEDGTEPLADVGGHVVFDGVSFSYRPGTVVLDDISFDVAAGDTFAIVGATGSGKTSIIKLLLRFYDPNRGTVRIDGSDLTKLRLADVRRAIALVSQDVFLFHGTVQENIAYGRPDATPADIERAARIAEAHDFILELPEGYDTIVGERGQKLSGGQRQRVSIARALVSDAQILVLDEATSAVDNETEAAIQRSLAQVAHDRTTIVIAHRLSTIRHADHIVVLDRGRITQRGTHDALIAVPGIYKTLWSVQTGEAVTEG